MVRFLDELQDFLRHPVMMPSVDIMACRRHFLAMLERRESEGADEEWLRSQQDTLGRGLELFVERLSRELLAKGIPHQDVPALVKTGISLTLGISAEELSISITRALVLRGAADRALKEAIRPRLSVLARDRWRNIAAYAREIRAVRMRDGKSTVTTIGRAFLDLTGVDAVKWLLWVETSLSTGPQDPWRVDRETLRFLAQKPHLMLPSKDWAMEKWRNSFWIHLRRLAAFGLLDHVWDQGEGEGYQVYDQALPVLSELGRDEESPMSVLVAAMLDDDLQDRLPARNAATAAEATVRQARLVVHEVRNALIPVKVALGSIYRAAGGAGIEGAIATYRQRVDAGLERVLSFAGELGEVARLTGEVHESFDTGAALREAVAAVQDEGCPAPDVSLPERIPLLRGVRSRFVLALVNLLRNAYQAIPAESARISVGVECTEELLHITIDDNGPGVDVAERARIFLDGYSTRPGGSGQGLALARAAIEGDMNGTLSCEDGSSLGGARFVITLTPYQGSAA